MKPFEYARPTTEAEAVELLGDHGGDTAVLAGGTDLITLLKAELLGPQRVVDIKHVESLREVRPEADGLWVGSLLTLEELSENPYLADYRAVIDVVRGVRAIQVQQNGTLGGDLCLLPNCWYFRGGHGLLGLEHGKSLVAAGDNRYHAILGNKGPAKFVSASRLAPALVAWGAKVRIVGPQPDQEQSLPLESFFRTPKTDRQGVTVLEPGQLVTHVWLPNPGQTQSGSYEVTQLEGLDWPLAAASACLDMAGGIVRAARVVLGHVAPTPWLSAEAARALVGRPVTEETATSAGEAALAAATPLKDNAYKVRIARTAVKRAILRAAGRLGSDYHGEV
jgi:xanthine dehydrogenase YagS FAD-binding subunit